MPEIVVSEPHLVAELLPVKQQKYNLLLLGLRGHLKQGTWQVVLDIIFSCIDVPKRTFTRTQCYHVGCSAASVTMRIEKGTITSYSNDKEIKTGITTRVKAISLQKVAIKPSLEVATTKFSPGKIESGTDIEEEYISTVECQEREIVITKMFNSISWRIEKPKVPMLIRDYLLGNYPFEASVKWDSEDKIGSIELVPLSIEFFNEKNKPILGTKALLFEYILWRKNIKVLNQKGIEFKFQVNE